MARTLFISNQIARLIQEQGFSANGTDTDFLLTNGIYYTNVFSPVESSEIEVYDNGLLCRKPPGVGEYTLADSGAGNGYDTVVFTTAPLSGHDIRIRYRLKNV